MTAAPLLPFSDSLDSLLCILATHNIDDPKIYRHLCPRSPARLKRQVAALERVANAKYVPGAFAKVTSSKAFKSAQSRLKGKLFERITEEVLKAVTCFSVRTNIQTSTNEVDVLVTLGPSSTIVPALRMWGTHFICECKFHDSHVSTTWVGKLSTLLATHGASVGILISKKGIAETGRGRQICHLIEKLAIKPSPTFIVTLDFADLRGCIAGDNVLELIVRRFIEVRTSTAKLTALIAA